MKKIIALILSIFMLIGTTFAITSCVDDDDDGGECRICGRQTNWTYRGGGYLCYWCDN